MSRRHESLLNQYPLPQRLLIITHVFLVNGGHDADLASLHRKKKWLKNYYCIHYTHSTVWNNDEAYKTFPPLHGYCWNSIEHPKYFEQYYRRNTLEMSHFLVLVRRCLAPLRQELFIAFWSVAPRSGIVETECLFFAPCRLSLRPPEWCAYLLLITKMHTEYDSTVFKKLSSIQLQTYSCNLDAISTIGHDTLAWTCYVASSPELIGLCTLYDI